MTRATTLATLPMRGIFTADAVVCTVAVLLMLPAGNPLADITDLPANLLRIAGLVILPYVLFLATTARRTDVPTWAVKTAITINIVWAAGCVAVLTHPEVNQNALGTAFIIIQVVAVLIFAALQYTSRNQGT